MKIGSCSSCPRRQYNKREGDGKYDKCLERGFEIKPFFGDFPNRCPLPIKIEKLRG